MKKILSLALTLVMVLSLVACGSGGSTKSSNTGTKELPTINYWTTASQNVSDVFTEVIAAYNAKEDRACNVELQFILSGSGETALTSRYAAAYLTGKDTSYDIIETDLLTVFQEAGDENAMIDLDFSKLSNWDQVQMSVGTYPEKQVPYRGTTVAFAYDSAKLENPPQTWDELVTWIKENPGAFAYNTPDSGGAGKAFVTCAIYRLIDDPEALKNPSDKKWLDYMDAGFEWLADIHPYLYNSGGHVQYTTKNQGSYDVLGAGEVVMIPGWVDGTLDCIDKGTMPDTVKLYQLSDYALLGNAATMSICATSLYAVECYDFIDFCISVEAQQIFVDVLKAIPVIDASLLEQTEAVKTVSKLNAADFNTLNIGTLSTNVNERWTADIATLGN